MGKVNINLGDLIPFVTQALKSISEGIKLAQAKELVKKATTIINWCYKEISKGNQTKLNMAYRIEELEKELAKYKDKA